MKILKTALTVCCFYLVFNGSSVFPQSEERSKDKSISTLLKDKRTNRKRVEPGDCFPEKETRSPFRYIIVNDDVQFDDNNEGKEPVPVRHFVKVLLEERAFNEENLIYLFKYLSKYYANPTYLDIEVHTNLMTLETIEESIADSTHSSRDDFRQFYKTASYSRFNDGNEGFVYYTGKSGKFVMKFVNLPETSKK